MNILEEKIELAKKVLELNDINLLEQIKVLLSHDERENVSDLPAHIKGGIYESLKQAENAEFLSYESVLEAVESAIKK